MPDIGIKDFDDICKGFKLDPEQISKFWQLLETLPQNTHNNYEALLYPKE